MSGKEVLSYAISKAMMTLGLDLHKGVYESLLSPGSNRTFTGMVAVLSVYAGFTLPYASKVLNDSFQGGDHELSSILEKVTGPTFLDAGVVVGTLLLLTVEHPVEAVLLKLGYNLALSVVPDALRSIRR